MTTTTNPLSDLGLSEKYREFLCTVFTTAIEGGIQYWAEVDSYHWEDKSATPNERSILPMDTLGFKALISPSEAEGGEWGVWDGAKDREQLTIDLLVMARGVQKFILYCHGHLDSRGKPVPEDKIEPLRDDHYWRNFLIAEASLGREGDYDAEVADQVVQWGLFGQGIYG